MHAIPSIFLTLAILLSIVKQATSSTTSAETDQENAPPFRVGVATVDVSPTSFPSIIAGGFLEGQAKQLTDRLFVRCFAFDDGKTKIVFAVVDTCMMTQALIDEAKERASKECGIPIDHMTVSATHTHSAPAAMGCLGTRQDKTYAASLPAKIAEGILLAVKKLQPAKIGWSSVDDWEHTHNRRWIRKPETKVVDPFGKATGLANMHPGYLSPDVIGPSGPVDPTLSILAAQSLDGKPLAVLANYSQHYFGATAVSADYYGHFCKHVALLLNQPGEGNGPFVCAMSQGTSGDCMWMDYGVPKKSIAIERYAEEVARYAEQALKKIEYRSSARLAIVEKKLTLNYRVPDEERLAWARPIAAKIEQELPKDRTEVYAQEAIILHERQKTELKLQAISIGELTITTLPNEVYALTGLKLRNQSPAQQHFNIELANGAEGYIPTPEQHTLGGYTTWPARTAGLEVQAEPKIVETLLGAVEEATKKPRRPNVDEHGPYAEKIIASKPFAYWRLNEMEGQIAHSAVRPAIDAALSNGFAWYLPGVGSGSGIGSEESLAKSNFSGPKQINRALHLAGGSINANIKGIGESYSIALWFWLGEASGASDRTGELFRGPNNESLVFKQGRDHQVQLSIHSTSSKSLYRADKWHLALLTREGQALKLFVDGQPSPEIVDQVSEKDTLSPIRFGDGLQGKLDEIAVFDRVLSSDERTMFWKEAGLSETKSSAVSGTPKPDSEPLSPEESLKKVHVPSGYRVELVAAEPNVLDPIAFDWDGSGRLWVIEMADYPLGMDGKGKPGGRVRILEDVDQDGRYEKSSLYAEGLNFPTGILTWRDGVLVTAAPELLFLRDTDGDGKADSREVLLEGFNQGNQQLRLNGLRWGIDNWVYCANGGHHANYGKETRVESKRAGIKIELGSRDFRFQPDTGAIELESGPSQYGRNRNAWGDWFGTQNANPLWHYVLPDRYSARNPFVPTPTPIRHIVGPGSPLVFPASPAEKRYHSFEQSGRFTSACGGSIYGDRKLFLEDQSAASIETLHALTCEPFHNLVQHNRLQDAGVSYVASRAKGEEKFDFFASEDRWCRPVMIRTGPDGNLWIADMYRYMIEHPDWLPQQGKDELMPHYRLGDDRGRIYRVSRMDDANSPANRSFIKLDSLDTNGLVQAFDCYNDWQRDKIQQILQWRKAKDAIPLLEQLFQSSSIPQVRLQVLWTIEGLGDLKGELLIKAMSDTHPKVRLNALKLAELRNDSELIAAASRLATDSDPKVRMQFALSAGYWKGDDGIANALLEVAQKDFAEPLTVAAVMSSALPNAKSLQASILRSDPGVIEAFREPMLRLALGTKDNEATASWIAASLLSSREESIRNFVRLLASLERCGTSWAKLQSQKDSAQLKSAIGDGEKILEKARAIAKDPTYRSIDRIESASLLTSFPDYREAGMQHLADWLRPQSSIDDQSQAMGALAKSGSDLVPGLLAKVWRDLSPALRDQALDAWLSRNAWAEDLLNRIESKEIPVGNLDPTRRDRLLRHPSKPIAKRAAIALEKSASPARTNVVEQYREALRLTTDLQRGKLVYLRACAACHKRGNEGLDIGPNLATVVSHPVEKLLTNILDPNADILPGYQRYTSLLETGVVLSGLLTSETANSVTMKLADGTLQTLARSEIQSLQNSNASLMPEELEKVIQPQELADLIAYLRSPVESDSSSEKKVYQANAETSRSVAIPVEELLPKERVLTIWNSVGGQARLLRLFRMKERLAVSSDPNARGSERTSILEPPAHWWLGTKDRVSKENEPATFLVAAWTLLAFEDVKAKLIEIPEILHEDRPAYGIRISESIKPAMDCYFDRESNRLVRIDWRADKHIFSQWKEVDGVAYPSKVVGYKIKENKEWYHTEILEIERLMELPDGLTR